MLISTCAHRSVLCNYFSLSYCATYWMKKVIQILSKSAYFSCEKADITHRESASMTSNVCTYKGFDSVWKIYINTTINVKNTNDLQSKPRDITSTWSSFHNAKLVDSVQMHNE